SNHEPTWRYFFSTFHNSAMGAMITPERFERYAVGRMNCAVGTYGTNSKARACTASAAFFDPAASVDANHASRNSSVLASSGQPNQPFWPVPRTAKLTAGEVRSGPTSQVWKIDQPPFSTGSLEVRRVINVPQSPACRSDRKSTRLNSSHLVISYAVFCLKKKKNKN